MENGFVSGTGSIELDNDCQYSIDLRSTRSRESVVPKDDLAFYFNTYIEPKYGLGNINVNNVASFMKDLEMNWTKLDSSLKDKVLNIMVDNILNNPNSNYDFKNRLLNKLGNNDSTNTNTNTNTSTDNNSSTSNFRNTSSNKSKFGTKSKFGSSSNNYLIGFLIFIAVCAVIFVAGKVLKFF